MTHTGRLQIAGAAHWSALEDQASARVLELLPTELPLIHGLVDESLGLRETLKVNLRRLTPAEFEGLLHPVFQEDELTLILVGCVLGLAVGYAQAWSDARAKRRAAEAGPGGDGGGAQPPLPPTLASE